jgi:hypothetical protein
LRRSAGGWEEVAALQRGRERWAADERILGSGAFVESVLRETVPPTTDWPRPRALTALPLLLKRITELWGVGLVELQQGSRRRRVAEVRAVAASLAVVHLGLPAALVARELAVTPAVVRRGVERGPALLTARQIDAERLLRALTIKVL